MIIDASNACGHVSCVSNQNENIHTNAMTLVRMKEERERKKNGYRFDCLKIFFKSNM